MPQSWDMGQILFTAEDFYARKIQRLRPGFNPQTWVPEASMLTTRPPKPSCFQAKSVIIQTSVSLVQVGVVIDWSSNLHFTPFPLDHTGADHNRQTFSS